MTVIPAIDLIDGKCVRLSQGSFDSVRTYNADPLAVAQTFADAGAKRLHVVDLDAARSKGNNRRIIAKIRKIFPGKMDVGGGIRTLDEARQLKDIGIDFMVIGTKLAKNPQEVAFWITELGKVFIAGIDARNGDVKILGWKTDSTLRATDLAAQAKELGLIEIIYTDISRDGTMQGPNIPATKAIAQASDLPVTISGGVGNMMDLEILADNPPLDLTGVIIGKALYEGSVDLAAAIQLLETQNE